MPIETTFPYDILERLCTALDARQADLKKLSEYHMGMHRLAFSSSKFREAFGGLFSSFADNFAPLIVNAVSERLEVQGFRHGDDPKGDPDAWRFWQANNLDAQSRLAHKEALIKGDSYAIVWGDATGQPKVSVETPNQVIVAFAAGDRTQRVAAMKRWEDGGGKHAVLFLPGAVFRFLWSDANSGVWAPEPGFNFPMTNPLGVVPVVPLVNDPELDRPYGRSEFVGVIPIQDAINKLVADMMVASEYIAYPQRYVTGIELPTDDKGNSIPPYQFSVNKFLVAEDGGAQFGTLAAGDLNNYIQSVGMLVNHLATQTRTPPQYFNIGGNLPSGDAIKSAETGLVSKVKEKHAYFGEAWEEVIRLCFKVVGDPRAEVIDSEMKWKDPEFRSEAELADALVKRSAIGVPRQQLWEDAGYSPTQIARFHEMELQDSLDGLLVGPVGIPKVGTIPVIEQH